MSKTNGPIFSGSSVAAQSLGQQQPSLERPEAQRRLAYLRQTAFAPQSALGGPTSTQRVKKSNNRVAEPGTSFAPRKDSLAPDVLETPARSETRSRPTSKLYPTMCFSLNHSFKYFGYFAGVCLALFMVLNVALVSVTVAYGTTNRLPYIYYGIYGGVYQLFNCGLTSEVENPFTCDR